ncbi:MAG: hypothetical protein ABIF85_03750 [Nanoarchaeota archaeon]|nr:hypothetical protein [Nanoarchaeota archaeon]MBU4300108.1 hypothetical protein [Nanoarchaeota archaeon]MBU4452310.1 hypothetical protein [Nanoarchaeota archaeon]MCG2723836.1 hypothetical protein [archaeon]
MNPKNILEEVRKRIFDRLDSLLVLDKDNYKNCGLGFEAWFKIEVLKALESLNYDVKVRNMGPDLVLNSVNEKTIYIELKSSNESNNYAWIKSGLKQKHSHNHKADMCLFLMRYPNNTNPNEVRKWENKLKGKNENDLIYLPVNDTTGITDISKEWVVGIIEKKQK